jgi:hypothetical protein
MPPVLRRSAGQPRDVAGNSHTSAAASAVAASPTEDLLISNAHLRREATVADEPDVHRSSDDESDVARFAGLVDAPVAALGLPERAAEALAQALGVRTVRDLADNRYVRRAQAILTLAKGKNPQ